VQAHDVALQQQLVQRAHLACVAQRQLGDHVEEGHLHAQCLGQHGELRADGAVAHDAQRLAADLEGVLGRLEPAAAVRHRALFRDAAQQQDGFGQHQFGDRARIGIRGVEDRHAVLARGIEIDLVGADAEGAHRNELLRGGKDVRRELRARADAEEMHVGHALLQVLLRQGPGQGLDAGVACPTQHFDCRWVNAFEQKELDLAFVEGGLAHTLGGSPDRNFRRRQQYLKNGRGMLAWCGAASTPQQPRSPDAKRVSPSSGAPPRCHKM
jgi:hypothetical protein